VFVGQGISQVPPHAQQDDLAWKLAALKGFVGVIGMSLYGIKIADLEIRNETSRCAKNLERGC